MSSWAGLPGVAIPLPILSVKGCPQPIRMSGSNFRVMQDLPIHVEEAKEEPARIGYVCVLMGNLRRAERLQAAYSRKDTPVNLSRVACVTNQSLFFFVKTSRMR